MAAGSTALHPNASTMTLAFYFILGIALLDSHLYSTFNVSSECKTHAVRVHLAQRGSLLERRLQCPSVLLFLKLLLVADRRGSYRTHAFGLFCASGNALIVRRKLFEALHRAQLGIGTLAGDRLVLSKRANGNSRNLPLYDFL